MRLTIDFETKSVCDIKKHGAWVYSEHPTTDIICCAVKVDDQPARVWLPMWAREAAAITLGGWAAVIRNDQELFDLLEAADAIEAHNVFFERGIWENIATPRYGWPPYDPMKMRCSMAKCLYHALPRSLDAACKELALSVQKDEEGYKLMMKMCKPRRLTTNQAAKLGGMVDEEGRFVPLVTPDPEDWPDEEPYYDTSSAMYYWHESPEQIIRLARYCITDTEAEHCLSSALADLPPAELAIWRLDQEINRRGVLADVQTIEHIIAEIARYEEGLLNEVRRLTNQQVQGPKQIAVSLAWLNERGAGMTCLDKQAVGEALGRDDLQPEVRRFLEIRRTLGKASTAKYEAIRKYAGRDGRVRGTLIYHGAATGRWSGAGPQVHNLPRGSFEDVEECVEAMKCGGFEHVELLWGDPMAAASTIIRPMFVAQPGHSLFVSDFSSVEARVLAWLAGEEKVLDAFRNNACLYCLAASDIYPHAYEEIYAGYKKDDKHFKSLRQVGKTIILACIAEGELVLTDVGLVPIQHIASSMRVWDGVEFVEHDGVVFQGERDVISYGGLTATHDHVVWAKDEATGEYREVQFGLAAKSGSCLLQSGAGREAIRLGADNISGTEIHERLVPGVRLGALHEVQVNELGIPVQPNAGEEPGVPSLLPAKASTSLAGEARDRDEVPVLEPARQGMEALRGAGDMLQLPEQSGGRAVDNGKPRAEKASRTGSHRQPWALRTRESAVRYAVAEHAEPAEVETDGSGRRLGENEKPLHILDHQPVSAPRLPEGGHHRLGLQGRGGQAQVLAEDKGQTRKARVYDILNAGPRRRYTVSNCLVHNCGYQGGVGAFQSMAKNLGVNVPDEQAKDIVRAWRDKNQAIVGFWRALEAAALQAVHTRNVPVDVGDDGKILMMADEQFLRIQLPSGRRLHYYMPTLVMKTPSWGGDPKLVVQYRGLNSMTKKVENSHLYGGLLAENVTQAASRCLLAGALLRLEAAGYKIVLHVHDEAVAEVPDGFGSIKEFDAIMATVPSWAAGLPLGAKGFVSKVYKK